VTRLLVRAGSCALLGGLLGAAFLVLLYGLQPQLTVEFDRDLPRLVGGVYGIERDNDTGTTFIWTREEFVLRLPGLDRRVDWVLDVDARGAHPPPGENPVLSFAADGIVLGARQSGAGFENITVTLPARPERPRGAVITIRASRTFSPGAADPRELGFMLDRLRLKPLAMALPPRSAIAGVAAAAAILTAGVALLGVTSPAVAAAAVLIAAGTALLAAKGFGPYSGYPLAAVTVALWTALVMVIVARAVERRNGVRLRNTARFALAFSAAAAFMKLLVLLHPDLPIGDALFHAHRFRLVAGGTLFFTSIAPGNYQFPYAPGLYVVAAPFASLVARDAGDMALLRIFVVAFDAVAAVLLYLAVVRGWGDRRAAGIAVALYHLIPLGFDVDTVGNLTNAFAQSLAVFALVMISSAAVRLERPGWMAALTVLTAAAYMSHTSTFAILFGACILIAAMFWWKGGSALRSPAAAVLAAGVAAFVLAVVLYYGHFGETYRTEFARISSETAQNAPDAGGRTAATRLSMVPRHLAIYFGVPVLLLAASGAWGLAARGGRDRLTLAIAGWAVACLAFLLLGIATPVDMRYYLASIPALAIAGAAGASWMWGRGGPYRTAAITLLVWASYVGVTGIIEF
jgi:hypothetical protein